VVPLGYYVGNIAFVSDPSLLGQVACDGDCDLVVVSVGPRTLAVVVSNPVTSADSDRPVAADVEDATAPDDASSAMAAGPESRLSTDLVIFRYSRENT